MKLISDSFFFEVNVIYKLTQHCLVSCVIVGETVHAVHQCVKSFLYGSVTGDSQQVYTDSASVLSGSSNHFYEIFGQLMVSFCVYDEIYSPLAYITFSWLTSPPRGRLPLCLATFLVVSFVEEVNATGFQFIEARCVVQYPKMCRSRTAKHS